MIWSWLCGILWCLRTRYFPWPGDNYFAARLIVSIRDMKPRSWRVHIDCVFVYCIFADQKWHVAQHSCHVPQSKSSQPLTRCCRNLLDNLYDRWHLLCNAHGYMSKAKQRHLSIAKEGWISYIDFPVPKEECKLRLREGSRSIWSFAYVVRAWCTMMWDDYLTSSARPMPGRKFRKNETQPIGSLCDAEVMNCSSCEVHQRMSKWWLRCGWNEMRESVHDWPNEPMTQWTSELVSRCNEWTDESMMQWIKNSVNQWINESTNE